MRAARGFTLIELGTVITIVALLIPTAYAAHAVLDRHHREALFALAAADGARRLSEALRADLRTGHLGEGLAVEGPCPARYAVEQGALVRAAAEACGGREVLARDVAALERRGGLVEVTFQRPQGPDAPPLESRFRVGVLP